MGIHWNDETSRRNRFPGASGVVRRRKQEIQPLSRVIVWPTYAVETIDRLRPYAVLLLPGNENEFTTMFYTMRRFFRGRVLPPWQLER